MKYINLNQLMASVEGDLDSFADSNMIDRGKVIKVIRHVNDDLGLKINAEKQAVVDIHKGIGRLPEDFLFLQMALICTNYQTHVPGEVFGTHTEESTCIDINLYTCEKTNKPCVKQIFKDKVVTHTDMHRVKIHSKGRCVPNCPNLTARSIYDIYITPEDELITNFEEGKVYVSYLSDMVDEDNNILIPDHPLVRDYYEYAVKQYLLEKWMINNDADVGQRLQRIDARLMQARLRALNFINTVEYSEIQDIYRANRTRFYNRHISIFG